MSTDPDLDQVFARIEALAATRHLPGIARTTHDGAPALMLEGKAVVRLQDANTIVLRCPPEQKALLMEISPDIYFETEHYVGRPAVLVRLSAISDEELTLRLDDSWRFKAQPGATTA